MLSLLNVGIYQGKKIKIIVILWVSTKINKEALINNILE